MVQQYGNFNWKLAGGQNVSACGARRITGLVSTVIPFISTAMSVFTLVCEDGFLCVIADQWHQHFGGEHCRQWRGSSSIQGRMLDAQIHMLLFQQQ